MSAPPASHAADPPPTRPVVRERTDSVSTWPHLYYRELLAAMLVLVALSVLSIVFDAPLEDPADAARTPNPAKAPWYFLGLQELLGYFDPWIAGVAIPLLIVAGLCAIPYIDPSREAHGVYAWRERRLAMSIYLAGLAGWFVLIAIGLWFRGPGWSWVWPWSAAATVPAAEAGRALPNLVGVPLVLAYVAGGGAWIVRRTRDWPRFTPVRRWIFALLLLGMAGTLLKILLKILFGITTLVSFGRFGFGL
jgi:hypothetical protein